MVTETLHPLGSSPPKKNRVAENIMDDERKKSTAFRAVGFMRYKSSDQLLSATPPICKIGHVALADLYPCQLVQP